MAIAAFLIIAAAQEVKAELDYEIRAGAAYTDNVRRVSNGEEDDTIAVAGFSVDWSEERRRFEANVAGDFDYFDYLDNTFDSDNVSLLNAGVLFKVSPGLFHWSADNTYGTIRSDPFAAETPEFRENVNRFSTGPDFFFRLNDRTSLNLNGRYALNEFEESRADNDAVSGSLSLVRGISRNRSVSLNISADRIDYDTDDEGTSGFDRVAAFFGFNSRISRGTLDLAVGVNELHDADEKFSGTYAKVGWSRELSAISSVSISYSQQYSYAGDLFSRVEGVVSGNLDPGEIIPVRDPLENRDLSLGYSYRKGGLTCSVFGYVREDDYQENISFDNRRLGGIATIGVALGPDWNLRSRIRYEDWDFDTTNRNDEYLEFLAAIERRISRRFWFSLEHRIDDRASTISGQDYTENRTTLYVSFRPTN
ncbi:outer membrane beta-barrel protein [Lentisalinibacter sediminis]|uniref:outer membrane beta-barrel protein n=1 Tax=Lentisalinibacter sediminis TaxID=2992237 RepID=UPI003864B130